MKWALIIVGGLVGLVALAWLIGALLPREHVASRMARYRQSPEAIWDAITNVDTMTKWRTELKSIERLPERDGKPAWREDLGSSGKLPIEVTEWDAPRRMVTRITDDSLPFGGTWTYEIAPSDGGASLRITERGFVNPALFRFMSRYIFGQTSTMETYLKNLGKKFGEDVAPTP